MPENEEKNVSETPAPQDFDSALEALKKAQEEAAYYKAKYDAGESSKTKRFEVNTIDFWRDLYHNSEAQQKIRDREERRTPDLRIEMVKLVALIGELIDETAGNIQFKREGPEGYDPFEVDEIRDVVAWQLAEFMTMAIYDRDDETYEYIVKGRQWTRDHACYWFDVEEGHGPENTLAARTDKPAPESDGEAGQDEEDVNSEALPNLQKVSDDQPHGTNREETDPMPHGTQGEPATPANIIDLPGYPSIETAAS